MNIERASTSAPGLHKGETPIGEPVGSFPESASEDVETFLTSLEGLTDSEKAIQILTSAARYKSTDGGEYELRRTLDSLTDLDEKAMDAFIEAGLADSILLAPERFRIQDPDTVIQKVTSADYLVQHEPLNKYLTDLSIYKGRKEPYSRETLKALLTNGYPYVVFQLDWLTAMFPSVEGLDLLPESFDKEYISQGFVHHIDKFPQEMRDEIVRRLLRSPYAAPQMERIGGYKYGTPEAFIEKLDLLSQDVRDELAAVLISHNDPYIARDILANAEKFRDIDYIKIAEVLVTAAAWDKRMQISTYIDNIPVEHHTKIAEMVLEGLIKDPGHAAQRGLSDFITGYQNLDKVRLTHRMFESETLRSFLLEHYELFKSKENVPLLINALMKSDFVKAAELNRSYTPSPLPELADFTRMVGPYGSEELYESYLKNGADSERLQKQMDQVRSAFRDSDADSLIVIKSDPELLDLGMAYTRVDVSDWGHYDRDEFKKVITKYIQERETYRPLPAEYKPGTIETFRKKKSSGEAHKYSPEFTERWKTLLQSLHTAQGMLNHPEILVDVYSSFTMAIESEKSEVTRALENPPNDMARKSLEERAQMLDSISIGSIEDMSDAFEKLYDRKKRPMLTEVFRQYGLYAAFKTQFQENNIPNFYSASSTEPSAEDISKVLEFVQHVTHQETWEKNEFFATKAAQEGLNSLFHVKALENELQRMTGPTERGSAVTLEVVPSRDILTELSGQMGDACWAGTGILKNYSHISSLSFFLDGDVAGSSLLIDTETKSGEKITIIRGLNPLERVINKLELESFMDQLITHLGEVAAKRGRRLAIVIDDHSGGASTNRPMLFAYLSGMKRSLRPVKGIFDLGTMFNGYDIVNDTYYLTQ
jgi:hypothetical protein